VRQIQASGATTFRAIAGRHLFDHPVGAYQQPGRKFDPERNGCGKFRQDAQQLIWQLLAN
jgi:hypothetical protein